MGPTFLGALGHTGHPVSQGKHDGLLLLVTKTHQVSTLVKLPVNENLVLVDGGKLCRSPQGAIMSSLRELAAKRARLGEAIRMITAVRRDMQLSQGQASLTSDRSP